MIYQLSRIHSFFFYLWSFLHLFPYLPWGPWLCNKKGDKYKGEEKMCQANLGTAKGSLNERLLYSELSFIPVWNEFCYDGCLFSLALLFKIFILKTHPNRTPQCDILWRQLLHFKRVTMCTSADGTWNEVVFKRWSYITKESKGIIIVPDYYRHYLFAVQTPVYQSQTAEFSRIVKEKKHFVMEKEAQQLDQVCASQGSQFWSLYSSSVLQTWRATSEATSSGNY